LGGRPRVGLTGPHQDLYDDHGPTAPRATAPWFRGGFGFNAIRYRRMRHGQQLADAGDVVPVNGTGEQPAVADAMEALWQDIQQKAADELRRLERRRLIPRGTIALIIHVAEGMPASSIAISRRLEMATRWV
jgi:hypothetical protein